MASDRHRDTGGEGATTRLPCITIAVPSYNQGAFIRETLQSLVDQEYPNLEVIVQDAGSTDGSVEIAREFATRRPETFRVNVEKDRPSVPG
jgi:glycosyltransferase involved in cell wall biosynthesis